MSMRRLHARASARGPTGKRPLGQVAVYVNDDGAIYTEEASWRKLVASAGGDDVEIELASPEVTRDEREQRVRQLTQQVEVLTAQLTVKNRDSLDK